MSVANGSMPGTEYADAGHEAQFPAVLYTGRVTCHDDAWLPELSEENALHDDDMFLYEAFFPKASKPTELRLVVSVHKRQGLVQRITPKSRKAV